MTRCHNADVLMNYIKAGKHEITPQELRMLAKSSHERVRLRVAEHHRCPLDVLELLATDECPEVRSAVAVNPSTPKKLLLQLCNDADPTVRYAIAEDPTVDEVALNKLADDENGYVAWRARRTMERTGAAKVHRRFAKSLGAGKVWRAIKDAVPRRDTLQYA